MKEWKTIRYASCDDGYNAAELMLDKVPLTDHYEWTVHMGRLKPNTNYSKNYGWFHSEKEAKEIFEEVLSQNTDFIETNDIPFRIS